MKPDNLIEHPEGGRFREVFRSRAMVTTNRGQTRCALTHIYFGLNRGEVSRFHRVDSDEVWSLYAGAGLRLYTWEGTAKPPIGHLLSEETQSYCHVVPAGTWQAAEPIGDTVLVGCSVGPGFEFEDFELIDPDSEAARLLQSIDVNSTKFIGPQTRH
jgi:predicted cupin superfamily sugar epimerase